MNDILFIFDSNHGNNNLFKLVQHDRLTEPLPTVVSNTLKEKIKSFYQGKEVIVFRETGRFIEVNEEDYTEYPEVYDIKSGIIKAIYPIYSVIPKSDEDIIIKRTRDILESLKKKTEIIPRNIKEYPI